MVSAIPILKPAFVDQNNRMLETVYQLLVR